MKVANAIAYIHYLGKDVSNYLVCLKTTCVRKLSFLFAMK